MGRQSCCGFPDDFPILLSLSFDKKKKKQVGEFLSLFRAGLVFIPLETLAPLMFGIFKLSVLYKLIKFTFMYTYLFLNLMNLSFPIRFCQCSCYKFPFSFFLAKIQISFWAQTTQASSVVFIFQISNIKLT